METSFAHAGPRLILTPSINKGVVVKTIGVIMAGGKSRRMGRDKAAILYRGQTLLAHAENLLTAFGCDEHIILGRPGMEKTGTADPLPGEGPAANLTAWADRQTFPVKLVVLPVDMPLLAAEHLRLLDNDTGGGFFEDLYLPLVATLHTPIPQSKPEPIVRMKDLLQALQLKPVKPPETIRGALINFNSPEQLNALPSS